MCSVCKKIVILAMTITVIYGIAWSVRAMFDDVDRQVAAFRSREAAAQLVTQQQHTLAANGMKKMHPALTFKEAWALTR